MQFGDTPERTANALGVNESLIGTRYPRVATASAAHHTRPSLLEHQGLQADEMRRDLGHVVPVGDEVP